MSRADDLAYAVNRIENARHHITACHDSLVMAADALMDAGVDATLESIGVVRDATLVGNDWLIAAVKTLSGDGE